MKSFLNLPAILAALLASVILAIPFHPAADLRESPYQLELKLKSTTRAYLQVYFDTGHGMSETESAKLPVEAGSELKLFRFSMPLGIYRNIRIDPIDRSGSVEFADVRIVTKSGRILRKLPASDFVPTNQIATFEVIGNTVRLTTTPDSNDCFVLLRQPLSPVLNFSLGADFTLGKWLSIAVKIFAAILGLLAIIGVLRTYLAGSLTAINRWATANPVSAVICGAALAVILSCYPVVFLGKSFVSPNTGTALLYGSMPALPGYTETRISDVADADVGAIMWQHVPFAFIQGRALFHDGELPLWNRYNSTGAVLLGQGQSSFGDPLHFIPIAAGGAAWAWDIKYLLARFLFACGLGLIVWHGFRNLPAALLVAVTAPFIGHFVYRVNHPAIFSLCYSPWILYAWLRTTGARRFRGMVGWATLLIIANAAVLTSGTVKEAYMLIMGVNFTGVCVLLTADLRASDKWIRFGVLTAAGVVFVLITAPVWLTLLDSLSKAYSSYDDPRVYQLQPGTAIGLFDEMFFRAFMEKAKTMNPSLNFFLMIGVLWSLVCFQQLWAHRVARAVFLSALPVLALVFGVIPSEAVLAIPFLGNVHHIDNSFICVLIVQLGALAGFGFTLSLNRLGRTEGKGDILRVATAVVALAAVYYGTTHAVQRSSIALLHWNESLGSGIISWYFYSLLGGVGLLLGSMKHLAKVRGRSAAAILLCVLGFTLLIWRFGMHTGVAFQHYLLTPMTRVDFSAPSPAVTKLQALTRDVPARVVGIENNFFPGWTATYRLETICGPDALVNKSYREFMTLSGVDRLWDWRYVIHAATVAKTKAILDFLNVRFYLERGGDRESLSKSLKPLESLDLDIYESPTAWPRAFFTDRVAVYRELSDFVGWIKNGDGRPLAAFRENDWAKMSPTPEVSGDTATRKTNPARDYQLTNNRTAFTVDASGPGFIVLQEASVNREFKVTVNGEPTECLRINHAFKGIYVTQPGNYRVEFSYWPEHFTLALWMSAAGFLLLLSSIAAAFRYSQPLPSETVPA